MNDTIQSDATPAATGTLGLGTPPISKGLARYLAAEVALIKLVARVGEQIELHYREDAIPSRRWWLGFADGSPVAICGCPLEAVEAGEELL